MRMKGSEKQENNHFLQKFESEGKEKFIMTEKLKVKRGLYVFLKQQMLEYVLASSQDEEPLENFKLIVEK